MAQLNDIGERRIISDVVSRFCDCLGDDCAAVTIGAGQLVLTMDPVPEPAAAAIGMDPDPYWKGWLLAIINASDLAAAGAQPKAFLAAVEAPPDLEIEELTRFFEGVGAACAEEGLTYVGGNMREGPKLTAVGTAVGICADWRPLTRSQAKAGDIIVSVGEGGRFWRDAIALRKGMEVSRDTSPVFRPRSQLRAMEALARRGIISASIDNSDGLIPSIQQLCTSSHVSAQIDLHSLSNRDFSDADGALERARFWLGWGDWNVFATVSAANLEQASELARQNGSVVIPVGRMTAPSGLPEVSLRHASGRTVPAPRIESERFSKDSWFQTGIDGYIEILLNAKIS